jgi:predicted outer membrane repeat protein
MGGTSGAGGAGGTGGTESACQGTVCACTEAGIRAAIAEGGGPYTFDCDGPTTVVTEAEIVIDNDVILDGEGNLTVDGNEEHLVFGLNDGDVTAELRGFGVTNGNGGIAMAVGTLTLTNSTVYGNTTGHSGGGIDNGGALTLNNSTVSSNTTSSNGGGIFNHGSGTLALTNSTVSGNTATSGGGISTTGNGTLTNSTVSGNTATSGGGIWTNILGTLTLTNSLVDDDCDGTIVSGGHNIESPGDTCGLDQPTDQVNVSAEDLKLGPLQDNGGPTMTHALLPGSVAIDKIAEKDCVDADGEPLATDQRGEPRPETGGTMCDVGAFEVQP